jgi:hypothetical protein
MEPETRADEAAVSIALAPRTSPKLMGETEIGADQHGVIELPVRITLLEPPARGQTPRETLLYEVAAHELGHALGLPHTNQRRSLMCCVWGSLAFKDPAVRAAYIEGRRHPDLRSVEVQLKAHCAAGALDESRIRLPQEPLPVFLEAMARRTPDPACSVLHPPAGRERSDAAPLSADSRAHRATRVAPDLIERRIDRTRAMRGSERAGVSLKPAVGVTDPGNVRSRTVMRREEGPLSTCRKS